jgi:hypothetical protein
MSSIMLISIDMESDMDMDMPKVGAVVRAGEIEALEGIAEGAAVTGGRVGGGVGGTPKGQ